MAFLKLIVFSVAILLASSQKAKRISEIANVVDEAKEDIKDLKSKILSLEQKVEEQTGIEDKLVKEIEALKETFAEELKARKNDVMVLSGEEDPSEERCATVCAGSSGRGVTNWVDTSTSRIYTDVDISKCGFVKLPTVTTSLDGYILHWDASGSSAIYSLTTSSFRIYLASTRGRGGNANKWGWNVEWIAVGFTC